MANIYLVRHGESQANQTDLISSKLPGLGLTKLGADQIRKIVSDVLCDLDFVRIYTSPLLRTLETASIINKIYYPKAEIIVDDRIKEIDYGRYDGKKKEEVDSKIERTLYRILAGDFSIRFGEDGENESEIMDRIINFLIDIVQKNQNCVVVSHQGIIDIILQIARKMGNCIKKDNINTAYCCRIGSSDFNIIKLRSLLKTYTPICFLPYILKSKPNISMAVFVPSLELANHLPISTPFTFPFKDKSVVLALDKMGWWNPAGGHMEKGETWEQTLVREAKEETGIQITDIKIAGYIKIEKLKGSNSKYPPVSIIPITTSKVVTYYDNWIPMETKQRKIFSIKQAKKMLGLRADNHQMLDVFNYITNYCLNYD